MESTKIFVANLPERIDEEELRDIFSKYGPIKSVSLKKKNSDSRDAESALKEDGSEISGNKIRVERSNPRQRDDRDYQRRDDRRNSGGSYRRDNYSRRSRSRSRDRKGFRDERSYRGDRGGERGGFKERTNGCFNCKQDGHIAKNCTEPRQDFQKDARKPLTCFTCGKEGHKKFDCPQALESRGRYNDRRDRNTRNRSKDRRRSSSSSYKGKSGRRRSPSYENKRSYSKSNS